MTRRTSARADEDLVSPHLPFLLRSARVLTRSDIDAQDLVQSTCVRAFESLRRLPSAPTSMRAWLLVMLRRIWFNVLRERKVRVVVSLDSVDACATRSDSSLADMRATQSQILRAWHLLAASSQEIAAPCFVDDEPYDVVSARLGLAPGTVAKSIYRTRQTLKALLADDDSSSLS